MRHFARLMNSRSFEVVDGDHVGDAARVEGEDVVAADEAGGAGDENAHVSASMWCALRGRTEIESVAEEFVVADGGRAELADDDAARLVGDGDRLLDGDARGERGRENGDHGVARAPRRRRLRGPARER